MKNLLAVGLVLVLGALQINAQEIFDLKSIADSKFAAQTINGINPLDGTDKYVRISKDGKQIVQYSFKTGEQDAVLFDINNTQGEKIDSFDGYVMSPVGGKMLIRTKTIPIYRRSNKAVYYIYNINSRKLEKLSDGGPQQVPIWSPDGSQIAFVRDNNIFLVKLLYDNAEIQVTSDGKSNEIINGLPDWVYEEEFSCNRSLAFTVDGSMLCWIKYDESKVRSYMLQMYKGLDPEHLENTIYPSSYSYKYPKAGESNSVTSVWSYDIKTHKTQKLQVPLSADGYMPRIISTNESQKVMVYTLNRHQDELNLYSVDSRSTLSQLVIQERVPKYIKEETISGIIIGKNNIIVPSDRDGYMRIYVYSTNGVLTRKIGDGNYDITELYGCNEENGDVFYQAAALNSCDRQIFVSHKNGKIERLTDQEGWNSAIFSKDYTYFINTWSDLNHPYVYTIRNNKGKTIVNMLDNQELMKRLSAYRLSNREMFNFTTSEGIKLNGWIVKPNDFDASKSYPVIMFQYAGPGSQEVINSWGAGSMGQGGLYDQYLAKKGFLVVCVDGRGTGGRGSEFEKSIYQNLGKFESKDQVETALYLSKLPYVDKDRIGIWGWSYGGFNTLMSMSEGRGVFRAGVAVAPPTDWRYYDTVYTERFMRTPKENAEGYGDNPISRANKLHGALLICHGTADDNVNPQNTFEYAEALVQADKDFKEVYYTNRNHSISGGNTRNHLLRQISNFFETEFK